MNTEFTGAEKYLKLAEKNVGPESFSGCKILELGMNELDYTKIMQRHRQDSFRKDIYLRFDNFEKIKDSILNQSVTVIIGNPLSGKTRIVYEVLKEVKHGYLVRPDLVESHEDYKVPDGDDVYILLDDIEDYFASREQATIKLLQWTLDSKAHLIITCKTGPKQYRIFFENIEKYSNLLGEMTANVHEIKRFEHDSEVIREFIARYSSAFCPGYEFDGNIGSFFVSLVEMRTRFEALERSSSSDSQNRLSVVMLKGMKFLYNLYCFEGNRYTYKEKTLKEFCKRYLRERSIGLHEWERARHYLEESRNDLNFISVKDGLIQMEEVYLTCYEDSKIDVIRFNLYDIVETSKQLFDKSEFKVYGIMNVENIESINSKMKDLSCAEALWVFTKFVKKPIRYTYHILIFKSNSFKEAMGFYREMLLKNIRPTQVLLNTMMFKAGDVSEAIDALELYQNNRLFVSGPSIGHLKRLSAKDKEKGVSVLDILMKNNSIEDILNDSLMNLLVRDCYLDLNNCIGFYEHYREYLFSCRDNVKYSFAAKYSELGVPGISHEIIESTEDRDFHYFLNKAIAFRGVNFTESEKMFNWAVYEAGLEQDNNHLGKAYFEMAILYSNCDDINYRRKAIGLCKKSHLSFHNLELHPEPLRYLFYLIVKYSSIDRLIFAFDRLVRKYHVGNVFQQTFLRQLQDAEPEKHRMIKEHRIENIRNKQKPSKSVVN